uniref:Uncharacterized protein n=1 Tax=mine drainage metagenome TaxID=410659 RepID=E6QVS0_9ZZZZ
MVVVHSPDPFCTGPASYGILVEIKNKQEHNDCSANSKYHKPKDELIKVHVSSHLGTP